MDVREDLRARNNILLTVNGGFKRKMEKGNYKVKTFQQGIVVII